MNKKYYCKHCGNELVTSDYGYYCCNKKCKLFDKDILAYDNIDDIINIKKSEE